MLLFYCMYDSEFIKRALSLAKRAEGKTSPNPLVGALLVKNGRIIAEGYHKKAGTPHAEAIVIQKAGSDAKGATLFVSLEPCCHNDKKTPPCTKEIISSGIKKVVIAMPDPNPKVSGKGMDELKKAGIQVFSGVLEDQAVKLNEIYVKHITNKTPFVILKAAMTLDGKIATPKGESKWITGEKARRAVHILRGKADAVMTAIGTIKTDNPQLTCRVGKMKNPYRIIIDPDLEIKTDSAVLSAPPRTFIVTKNTASEKKKKMLIGRNIGLIEFKDGLLDLKWLMKELYQIGITSLLIEGGSSLNSYCLESGIVDKVIFFIAPKIIGGKDSFPVVGGKAFRDLNDAIQLKDISVKRLGEDIMIEGYLTN